MYAGSYTPGVPEAKLLGMVGAIGAATFALVVTILTVVHWSFLRERGWDLVKASDIPFPSILALSPTGWIQILNFAILGISLLAVAAGLWGAVEPRPTLAIVLLGVAGIAGFALMAPTDGSVTTMRTTAGAIHVVAFIALLVCIVLAALLFGLAVGSDPAWAPIAGVSIGAAVLIVVLTIVSFVVEPIGGLASVLSILVMLGWVEIVAIRLATST